MKEFLRRTVFYTIYKRWNANIAVMLNSNPSKNMFVVGITGTDGKTTTTNLIHKIVNDNLGKACSINTASIKIGNQELFNYTKMTSLDPMELQKLLSGAKEQGCKYAILEVSSHGIEQYRFGGVEFDLGVLTNITSEHLDYHKTIDNYANTKKKLFQGIIRNSKKDKLAVLPKDNEYGRRWYEGLSFDKVLDFGILTSAALKAEDIAQSLNGISFTLKYLGKSYKITSSLLGKFNVYNILAAIGAGLLMGIPIEDIISSVSDFPGLPGRLQKIEHNGVNFFVDFAHTPNALDSVLKFLKDVKGDGKIITVFGATGERDRYKRPEMGKIACMLSDVVILTDDDPGNENRYDIIKDIMKGVNRKEGEDFFIIPEREFALKMALNIAKPGDIVFFAGKGHEKIQITNFGKREWNDKDKLLEYINLQS